MEMPKISSVFCKHSGEKHAIRYEQNACALSYPIHTMPLGSFINTSSLITGVRFSTPMGMTMACCCILHTIIVITKCISWDKSNTIKRRWSDVNTCNTIGIDIRNQNSWKLLINLLNLFWILDLFIPLILILILILYLISYRHKPTKERDIVLDPNPSGR